MISMIWISQTVLRFADTDLFTTLLCGLIVMGLLLSFKNEDERRVTVLFQYLIAGFFYIFTLSLIRNKYTQYKDEKKDRNPKKEQKKKKVKLDNRESCPPELHAEFEEKKIPKPLPAVTVEEKKRKKKQKRLPKKTVIMENREPSSSKAKTKIYENLNTCMRLNRDEASIHNCLSVYKLTEDELTRNNYPCDNYRPPTLVEKDDSMRNCVRCGEQFEIYKGLYLSATKCKYHPRRLCYDRRTGEKVHLCCDSPDGSPPCTLSENHVTIQHGPRELAKTPSKRHVRRDLQHRIFSLDCEMSYTTGGLEVTRIGVVDINGTTVFSSFVKPKNRILDYNTQFSGVEKKDLEHETTTTESVLTILQRMIQEDTILIGHALNNDLASLGLIHTCVIDTSVMYPNIACPMRKKSLKSLSAEYLGLAIQNDVSGHDCIEDARACLQLALLKVPRKPFFESSTPRLASRQPPVHTDVYVPRPLGEHNCGVNNTYSNDFLLVGDVFDNRSGNKLVFCPATGCFRTVQVLPLQAGSCFVL